ncbi:alkene reductase [Actinoplanes palleronii]|uniref:Alkene reductase n=1 Tax=Actinoplanes palleronii TaxID=113570 RepID=A0ABQ4BHA0_9ACTN|nr:alkene reductase [Actinoplanes palleronii]GIE70057.1 alkene reductase [Actinoplanes palleronii]
MKLFTPVQFGSLELKNRLVMAPLTRIRADENGVPGDLLVEYYRQRASMGLIVTEGTWPVREGRTWIGQPGIETAEQVAGWRRVADAVHAEGGTIVMQIMHGGRISHPEITGSGRTVAPSALAAPGEIRVIEGKAPLPVPDALDINEIPVVVAGFVAAARNAIAAGLDGVEVHGANGYLIHEFTSPASNVRTDAYGGSPENRARLAIEVVTAVAAAIGADRTGIRLSPEHNIQGALETDPDDALATYVALAEGLAPLGLAFVDILHADPAGKLVQSIRASAGAPVVVNTGFGVVTTRDEAIRLVGEDLGDAVAVGRAAIANPDLAERWAGEHPESAPDPSTFYYGGARGYTDYPTR